MADFNLGVALNADPSGFNNAMDNAAKKSADSFALIYDTAKQYLGMAGVAGTFARAADAAGKFYQAVADIGAISGQSLEGLDNLLLGIDSRITTALGAANTMYEVFSSGIDGTNKEITELTEIIGKTANVIRADIMSTGDAMTTIMNAWGIAATDAKDIMDGLFITVREGKAHGDELARTLGLVTATASAMGTELDDMFAAVAILSRTQSASQSMIGLNQMLNAIIKPTMEAQAAAKKWGVEISATAIQTKGLAGVLRELREKVGGNVEALEAMFGNIRAGRAVLALTGTQFDEYIKVLDQMRGKSGSAEEAFKKQMDTMRAETERFKNEVTKAFITVGEDTEIVTTTLAKFGSSLLESFRSSSSGIGDLVSDINDLLGTTKKIPEELDKQIKYFSRWTLYLMSGLRALRAYKDISDRFTKIGNALVNTRGGVGGDGETPKTPRTPTSKFSKDTEAINATDKALQRMTTTITTQVSPAVRGLSDTFVSIKESVKAIATEVITLDDKINTAKAATSGFATAVTGLKTALGDVSKLASTITTEMAAAGNAVNSTNLGLKLTLSNLAAIRVEQALVKAGYAAHTAAITATNHALTQQIALLQTSRAMLTGGPTSTPTSKPFTPVATGSASASPRVPDAAGSYGSYEDKLYRDYVNSAVPNYSYENQLEREFFFGAGPKPKAVNNKRYTQRDSKGRFVKATIFPAPVSGGATSLDAGFDNVTNISTAPTSTTPQPTGTKIPWRSSTSFMLAPVAAGGGTSLSDGFTGPKIPASRLKQRIPDYPGPFSTYPVGTQDSYTGNRISFFGRSHNFRTLSVDDVSKVLGKDAVAKLTGKDAPITRLGEYDAAKLLSRLDKDGIKIKNTGDIAESITNTTARMPGFGGVGGVGNVLLMLQVAQMGYQFGKALDAQFGISDKLSDAWTGAGVMRAQQTAEGMQAQAAIATRLIERDLANPTGPKLNVVERMELQRRIANAPNEEARIAINNEYRDLINQRTTPAEARSEQLRLAQEKADAAKKDLEEFRERMKTAPLSIATPSRAINLGKAIDRYAKEQEMKELKGLEGEPISSTEAINLSFTPLLVPPIMDDLSFTPLLVPSIMDDKKEKRIKERSDAIQMLQRAVTGKDFGKFYENVKAGDFEAAGLGGYSEYQRQVIKDIIDSAELGAVNMGEILDIEKVKKGVATKSAAHEQQVKFVNSLDEMDDALDKAILDAAIARIDEYKGLGMENFTEASMESAQAIYDEARKVLDEKTSAYNKRLDELKASGMPEAEIETTMANAKDRLNAAFTKLTTAEKGIYDAINRWQANLTKTILEAAEGASGISMNVMSRTDLSLGGKQLTFANTATEEAALAYRNAKTDLKNLQDELAQAAPDSPEAKKLQGRIEVQRSRVSAAERVFFGEQDKELNLNKTLTGRKINMFQMQMEQADILKSIGKIGGATYQDVQRTMLKNIESEARDLYERASADYKKKGEDSIYSDLDILEFGVNLHRASEAVINFAKSLDNSRDRAQQAIMGATQSLAGMKDPRGDLTATALYHSINFMARLAPPERLLGSPTMPTGALPEALNFKNATDAQASVARALDAYIMSQQYRQAGLATTVENIYSTLRSGSSIVVR